MPVEKGPDPYELIQDSWPPEDEEKLAAAAASHADLQRDQLGRAEALAEAITGLNEETFAGLTADVAKTKMRNLMGRHEDWAAWRAEAAAMIGGAAEQVGITKVGINATVETANAKIAALEKTKETARSVANTAAERTAQDAIDALKRSTRADIAAQAEGLKQSLAASEEYLAGKLDKLDGGGAAAAAPAAPPATAVDHPDIASPSTGVDHDGGAVGADPAAYAGGPAQAAAPMMGQQMPMPAAQAPPSAPSAGAGGGGSQFPGQELASKALDMAGSGGGGKDTFLSDDAVKDLLSAAGKTEPAGGPSSAGGDHGGNGAGGSASTGAGTWNPSAAANPSPAAPVTSRPVGGPQVPVTELAGASSELHSGTGLTSQPTQGLSSSTQVSVPAQPGTTGVSQQVPTQVPGMPTAGPTPVAPPPPAAPVAATAPAGSAAAAPPPPPPMLVSPPPVAPGVRPREGRAKWAPQDLLLKPEPISSHLDTTALASAPFEQVIAVRTAASVIVQLHSIPWRPSFAAAFVTDGVSRHVIYATADDISLLPADIELPGWSAPLHHLGLGEDFRRQWAGCADVVAKVVDAFDTHPQLNRSMIKHVAYYTRMQEVRDEHVPFTAITSNAAHIVMAFHGRPAAEHRPNWQRMIEIPDESQPAVFESVEQIEWLLDVAVESQAAAHPISPKSLTRPNAARLESASLWSSRWSRTEEAILSEQPEDYDRRVTGWLWACAREALDANDFPRASWYGYLLQNQMLPRAVAAAEQQ